MILECQNFTTKENHSCSPAAHTVTPGSAGSSSARQCRSSYASRSSAAPPGVSLASRWTSALPPSGCLHLIGAPRGVHRIPPLRRRLRFADFALPAARRQLRVADCASPTPVRCRLCVADRASHHLLGALRGPSRIHRFPPLFVAGFASPTSLCQLRVADREFTDCASPTRVSQGALGSPTAPSVGPLPCHPVGLSPSSRCPRGVHRIPPLFVSEFASPTSLCQLRVADCRLRVADFASPTAPRLSVSHCALISPTAPIWCPGVPPLGVMLHPAARASRN
jgi:hypothetical protein